LPPRICHRTPSQLSPSRRFIKQPRQRNPKDYPGGMPVSGKDEITAEQDLLCDAGHQKRAEAKPQRHRRNVGTSRLWILDVRPRLESRRRQRHAPYRNLIEDVATADLAAKIASALRRDHKRRATQCDQHTDPCPRASACRRRSFGGVVAHCLVRPFDVLSAQLADVRQAVRRAAETRRVSVRGTA
jgi:hypothetical protein